MIEPKALSKKKRDEIEGYLERVQAPMLYAAMAAEACWRMRCEALEARSVSDSAVGNFKLAKDGE